MPEIRVTTSGPFFSLGAGPVQQAVTDSIREIVNEGEKNVKGQLYPGHGLITGHYRRSVHGELTDSLHGRIHDSLVVYGPWLEGVSSRNDRSRFKGYRAFRNAFQRLEQTKDAIVRKHIARAIGRLS